MKAVLFLLLVILLSLQAPAQTTRRVLFLGNSYTYYNDMPQTLAAMAASTGDALVFSMNAPGGYTLDDHANNVTSQNLVKLGNWDYLVLQEQSQLPALPIYFSNGLYGLISLFREFNACGRPMFYMTWGRKNGDAFNCANFPGVCTYIGMDTSLRKTYIEMADAHGGELSPVGAAWRRVRTTNPALELYNPDESHPSAAGSYLAALCFYTTVFKKNPMLMTYNGTISPADASFLKQAVKAVVYDSLAYWDRAPTVPQAAFTYSVGNGSNEIHCINNSVDADTYLWDFGDGTTATIEHPTHSYATDGQYTITLTAYNCDITTTYQSSFQRTVSFCPFTPVITPASLTVCPNTYNTLHVQTGFAAYQWYQGTGNGTEILLPGATQAFVPCTGSNEYFVRVTNNGCTEDSPPASVYTYNNLVSWYIAADGHMIGQDTACLGDSLVLHMWFNKPPFPDDQLIDWTFNGQQIPNYHNDSLTITQGGVYTATLRHEFCTTLNQTKQATYTFINCATGVDGHILPTPVLVYPNPGNGLFTISCGSDVQATVYDMFGRKLLSNAYTKGKHALDLGSYVQGIYLLKIEARGQQSVIKLSVEK